MALGLTPVVRRAASGDWEAVAGLCADTGALGDPVEPDERETFARRWVGPYRELRPQWAFVAEEAGRLVGYLTGSPDTLAFEAERRRRFDPGPDAREFFPEDFLRDVWARHPAHLHVNVAARARGRGAGAALLSAFFAALRQEGVASAHVFCGEAAAGYWRKAGFDTLQIVEPFPGARLHALARAA